MSDERRTMAVSMVLMSEHAAVQAERDRYKTALELMATGTYGCEDDYAELARKTLENK
jgi:hypothetical protein